MFLSKTWKTPRVLLGLFALEFAGTVAMLAMFGIASPDLYRTSLWGDGALNGFNSNPNQILYAYANYEPLPKTPLVWSQFLTNFNVVISVLSMFILLVKVVLYVMHIWFPILSLVIHIIITALYVVSIYGQAGPDNSDPSHPSPMPWYLTKSCDLSKDPKNVHYCQMAKGTFAVTVVMLSVFVAQLVLAIYSVIPNKQMRHARKSSVDSDYAMTKSPEAGMDQEQVWHFDPPPTASGKQPKTPKTPMTPRTRAFNTLSNNLPLRHHNER
ncbi:MAG: hypothetical protein M4579_004928 [Chaenotheca gracillima]|nr:MAG: hypothetical protein M4579_004928 [Chaenotheca gracillima]